MIAAVWHGAAGPLWMAVLIAAQEWGSPPWEIAGGNKLTWLYRWMYWRSQQNKKDQGDLED